MFHRTLIIALFSLLLPVVQRAPAQTLVYQEDGLTKVRYPQPPERWVNPWPVEYERAYWERAQPLITVWRGQENATTHLESEKQGIPSTILAYLAAQSDAERERALKALTALDGEQGHTQGIDLYWNFTLKGQMRKLYLFEPLLPREYVQRFDKAAKVWSESDPRPGFESILLFDNPDPELHAYAAEQMKLMTGEDLGNDRDKWRAYWKPYADQGWKAFEDYERLHNIRPHPTHGIGTGPVGGAWDPKVRGFVVDARNTDNLRAMREVAVYLMAERTGNELTRRVYKAKLLRTALQFWNVGMGEWDSEAYVGHTFAAYLNLYDFAEDPEVKGYAKAILDYLSLTMATKYFHAGWGGPVKRDYDNVEPWPTAAQTVFPYFGAAPAVEAASDREMAFVLTSGYRPPVAIVKLAQKRIDQPFELLASKPPYEPWLPGNDEAPEFYQTQYFGRTFQLGTAAMGSRGDMSGFKLLAANESGTADYVVPASTTKKNPKNISTSTAGGDNIGQFRNTAILLNGQHPDADFIVFITGDAEVVREGDLTFVKMNKTYFALRPIQASGFSEEKTSFGGVEGRLLRSTGKGRGVPAGFVLEVGESPEHASFDAFRQAVTKRDGLELSGIAEGNVIYTDSLGHQLDMTYQKSGPPRLSRDGKPHDWASHRALFQPGDDTPPEEAPVYLGWKERTMHVNFGGSRFTATLGEDGTYRFEASE